MALNVMISRQYCSMKRKVKFYKVYALCPAGEDERDGLSMWVLGKEGQGVRTLKPVRSAFRRNG